MKKQYKILLYFCVIELLLLSLLKEMGVKVQSWAGNAAGTFLCLLPVQILLFLLGQDEQFKEKRKYVLKLGFG